MLFPAYRKLNHRARALADGRLITYHFYVGGATLLSLGLYSAYRGELFGGVAAVFGLASLVLGVGLQVFHRVMIRGPHRDAYLVTIAAALGRRRFPLLPLLLGVLVIFSIAVTILYLLAG